MIEKLFEKLYGKISNIIAIDNSFLRKMILMIILMYVVIYVIITILTIFGKIKFPEVATYKTLRYRYIMTVGIYFELFFVLGVSEILIGSIIIIINCIHEVSVLLIMAGFIMVIIEAAFIIFLLSLLHQMMRFWKEFISLNKLKGFFLFVFYLLEPFIIVLLAIYFKIPELVIFGILAFFGCGVVAERTISSGSSGTVKEFRPRNRKGEVNMIEDEGIDKDDELDIWDILDIEILESSWRENTEKYEDGLISEWEYENEKRRLRNTDAYRNLDPFQQMSLENHY